MTQTHKSRNDTVLLAVFANQAYYYLYQIKSASHLDGVDYTAMISVKVDAIYSHLDAYPISAREYEVFQILLEFSSLITAFP